MRFVVAVVASILNTTTPAHACGTKTDCPIGDRHYRIHLPETSEAASTGAMIFAHGFGGSDRGIMQNQSLLRMADDLGIALIALKSVGSAWAIPFSPRNYEADGRDEERYVEAVLDDAAIRFNIDLEEIVMSGFSSGAMFTWHMACHRPDLFQGFVPLSGTFWLRTPENCEAPLKSLVHVHGTKDQVVPLSGRQIRKTHQGDVMQSLEMYQDHGEFGQAKRFDVNDLACQGRMNVAKNAVVFCLFEGGHNFSIEHLVFGWEIVTARETIGYLQ